MNWDEGRFWLELGSIGMNCAIGLYVWATGRNRVTNSRISSLETDVNKRFEDLSTRVSVQDERLKGLPTHTDFIRIHERMDKVSDTVSEVVGNLKAISKQLEMINQALLERGRD
jgi:hypothetical protein